VVQCQSQWPLASWDCGFESRWCYGSLSLVDVVCSQVEVSAAGRSFAQKSPTEWGVSEYDRHIKVLVKIGHNNTLYTRTY